MGGERLAYTVQGMLPSAVGARDALGARPVPGHRRPAPSSLSAMLRLRALSTGPCPGLGGRGGVSARFAVVAAHTGLPSAASPAPTHVCALHAAATRMYVSTGAHASAA